MDGVSISREAEVSVAASAMFPGFRFAPTDEELVSYYLKKKLEGLDRWVEVIADIDFCKFEPWDLPAKSIIHSDKEWFFFSARGRKYPNGAQSRRATRLGYWKATGKERDVKSGANFIGTKRTLVFHTGRAPKGERTEWIMHEYCMIGQSQDSMVVCRLRRNTDFRPSEKRRNMSAAHNSNNLGIPDGGVDHMGIISGRGREVECSSRRCSSRYDSHSVECNDLVSEAEQKQSNSFVAAESCSMQQKDCGDEEDCYAEILKDDIINLDESDSLELVYPERTCHPPPPPLQAESRRQPLHPAVVPLQGTAYRRIRLTRAESVDLSPKCVINGFTNSHYLVPLVLVILTLLAFCCCIF